MLLIPTNPPPQPPQMKEQYSLPTGKVIPAKKSEPLMRRADHCIS
jgi:hypothetical protein